MNHKFPFWRFVTGALLALRNEGFPSFVGRALEQPIERPKSLTKKMLEDAVAKTKQPA